MLRVGCRLDSSESSFHPKMDLFRNFGVNRRNCLCGVQNRPPPRNAADFLELAEYFTFPDWKLTSALNETVDGHASIKGSRRRMSLLIGGPLSVGGKGRIVTYLSFFPAFPSSFLWRFCWASFSCLSWCPLIWSSSPPRRIVSSSAAVLTGKNIIAVPQGSIVKWVEAAMWGLPRVRPRDRVFGNTFRYEILVS